MRTPNGIGVAFIKMNVSGEDLVDHDVPRRLGKAHAVQVARRVARTDASRGRDRKPLSRQRFPNPPPQYDIVLL